MKNTASFILASTIASMAWAVDYPLQPAISYDQAQMTCPSVCHKNCAFWTGDYKRGSVCSCTSTDDYFPSIADETLNYQALVYFDSKPIAFIPINNDNDAVDKCPGVCHQHAPASHPLVWFGKWTAGSETMPAKCQCQILGKNTTAPPMGPITTQPATTPPLTGVPAYMRPITIAKPPKNVCRPAGTPETKAMGIPYGSSYRLDDEKTAEAMCPIVCKSFGKEWNKYWSNQATHRPQNQSECGCQ